MAKGLTARQEAVLQFVVRYIQEIGYPPSIREIGENFGIRSLRGVTVHLDALQRKGYIERANTPRSIRITHPAYQPGQKVTMLPLVGQIAAGAPILADENVEDLVPVPSEMVRNIAGAYILRVRGDSMSAEGINPRDLVVVKPQETASHGDLVAVLLGDEATIKRIHYDKDRIRLMPSNPAYDPIELSEGDEPRVLGKVVGLLRDYEGMAF